MRHDAWDVRGSDAIVAQIGNTCIVDPRFQLFHQGLLRFSIAETVVCGEQSSDLGVLSQCGRVALTLPEGGEVHGRGCRTVVPHVHRGNRKKTPLKQRRKTVNGSQASLGQREAGGVQ